MPAAGHCIQRRIDVGSAVSREPPLVLSADHLLVSSAGDLLSLRAGDVQWRTRFGLVGELKPGGEGAVLALGGGDLLSQLELRQVDVSTGRSRWRTHLPLDASTTPSAVLWTHANGQTLVAGHGSLVALHGMKAAPDPGNGQAESKGRRPRR